MPLTHTATFRVYHYDCDASGNLSDASHLRYMQEAAFDASAAVGYDEAHYAHLGCLWLARETEVEYLSPLRYGETVQITTWVGDFRRVRSRRFYEFRHPGTAELLARASTDWVYLDTTTLRPAVVPPEMIAAFAPDGELPPSERRDKFPTPPPPPSGAYSQRRFPDWRDIDTVQHVNNAAYLDYVSDLGIHANARLGWSLGRMAAASFMLVVRQHRIEYLQPALFDDALELATWISDVQDTRYQRHSTIRRARDGELLTRVRSLWACMEPASEKPRNFPAEFRRDLAPHIAVEGG